MPIEMRVDLSARVRFSTASGVITDRDFFNAYAGMASAAANDPTLDHLADFSNVARFEVSPEGLQRTADAMVRNVDTALVLDGAHPKVAIVAPEDAVFGLLRMYGSYRELQQSPVRFHVCRTMQEARDWLGLDPL